jgi:hypothetical protein
MSSKMRIHRRDAETQRRLEELEFVQLSPAVLRRGYWLNPAVYFSPVFSAPQRLGGESKISE